MYHEGHEEIEEPLFFAFWELSPFLHFVRFMVKSC